MRKLLALTVCFFILNGALWAQDISLKYGKVTNYELNMKVYDKDSTAEAVVLYDDGYTSYEYVSNDFRINQELKQKIKILKQEGVDRATISLPYYYKSNGDREVITNLEAYSYNMEDGKIVRDDKSGKYVI
jgi:hypothetical protein